MSRHAAKHARTLVKKTSEGGYVPTPKAAPAQPAAPTPPPPGVTPFFNPSDLITQDNFWSQWNQTFADLDRQLADLQRNTAFQRQQLADQHKSNVSGINDNAAARGISHSSIRDASQAQEQTNFTRADQNLTDNLNNYAQYVQKVKSDFQTQTLPGFNTAMDQQAVQNAQTVNDQYVPPPSSQAVPSVAPSWSMPVSSHAAKVVRGFHHWQAPRAKGWGGR